MVKFTLLSRRVLLSNLRTSSSFRVPSLHSHRHEFHCACAHSKDVPNGLGAVTFGPEVDAAIAPYLKKLEGGKSKEKAAKRTRSDVVYDTQTDEQAAKDSDVAQDETKSRVQVKKQKQSKRSKPAARGKIVTEPTEDDQQDTDTARRKKRAKPRASSVDGDDENTHDLISKGTKDKRNATTTTVAMAKPSDSEQHAHTPKEQWQIQKEALKKKFAGEAWNPRKKLSPDAMEGIRTLHAQDPEKFTTPALAQSFKVSPEAIRRILKSKWQPSGDKMEERRERWAKRHDKIWDQQAQLGLRPQRKKARQAEGPESFEELVNQKEALGEI